MIVTGIDMGALTTKAVVLNDDEIIGASIITATEDGEVQARKALTEALKSAGISSDDVQYTVVTGEGRKSVSFASKAKTTPTAIGKGANKLFPSAGMVIDVGGESSTVIRLTEKGRALVDAWVSGDQKAFEKALSLPTLTLTQTT